MSTECLQKSVDIYNCLHCDYNTSSKKDFNKHLSTMKHQKKDKSTKCNITHSDIDKIVKTFDCHCGKKYKERSGLWRHKKLCVNPEPLKIDTNLVIELLKQNKEKEMNDKEMMMTILKENSELKTMILDMCKTMTATASSGTTNNTINNTTNNNFNLNVFLNETCKDALNLADFVSSLQVKLKDLEETAKIGYTEGVSRIFINGLNELEVNMRPIHCSDLKRETLYVKNDDKWTKEDHDKPNITKAIKKVSNKNIQQIFEWQKKYPDYKDPESKQNDKYQEMLFTAMGGSTDEDQSNNIDKIIRNITKEVVINKNI